MSKKGISFLLSTVALASYIFVSCGEKESVVKLKPSDVDVWTVPATEKILQDKATLYDDVKEEKSISLHMAQNEYESSQVIISPTKDVPYYNVTVSDLSMAGTENKIESKDITVYNEKYIRVAVNYENNGAPTGMYPDALLPFGTAKKYGENTVKKDENQGIYITVKTALDQAPGVYTGQVTVDFQEFVETVPVTVKVADIAVSEERHAKNIFLTEWDYHSGELESGQEILDDYTEMLFRYRLSPNRIVTDTAYTDEDIAYYVDKSYEYMQDVRCSNITVPYLTSSYQGEACFEVPVFEKTLRAFAEKSFETGYNMFDKLVCYFGFLDEPPLSVLKRIEVACTVYRETLEKVASSYENDETITAENKAEVIAGIRNLRNVVTSSYQKEFAPYIDTWCPTANGYHTENQRKYYESQEEKWWYTCIFPRTPYPTYRIEDTLISARALSWMQAEYNVVGNLYWAVNVYATYDTKVGWYVPIEDYYKNPIRYPQGNGEGYLFYPGGQYGLDMPVASMRLEAIRDGLEEYELLYALKQKYEALSEECGYDFNADNVLSSLGQFLYNGTIVATDTERFLTAREQLFALSDCVQSDAGMCVIDSSDDGYGNVTMKVFAKDGCTVKEGGEEIDPMNIETVSGGKIYTVRKTLSNDKNEFAFSVEVDGKTYSYVKYAGGKVSSVLASDLVDSVESEDVTPETSLVDASGLDSSLSGNALQIKMPASVETMQSVRLVHSLIQSAGESSEKLVLHLYSDEEVALTISANYTKKTLYFDLVNVTLKKGLNTVEIPLGNTDWDTVGEIEALIFYFGGDYNQPERTVWLQDVILYNR